MGSLRLWCQGQRSDDNTGSDHSHRTPLCDHDMPLAGYQSNESPSVWDFMSEVVRGKCLVQFYLRICLVSELWLASLLELPRRRPDLIILSEANI